MAQQKALLIPSKQAPWKLTDVPVLRPNQGEVLIKVHATGLNPIDWGVQKHGPAFADSRYPAIMGLEGAGYVEETGEGVVRLQKGDKVFFEGEFNNRNATFQQYTIAQADFVAKLPSNISLEQAASIPLGLTTAAVGFYIPREKPQNKIGLPPPWDEQGAGLQAPWDGGEGKYAGQSIVVFGGASSVGQYAIQLAKLSGFSPIITTCSLHNADLVKSAGATHIIDRKADVIAEARNILSQTQARFPEIIYDAISAEETQKQAVQILAPGGTLLTVHPLVEALKPILAEENKAGFAVYGGAQLHQELGTAMFGKVTELIEAGKLKPNVIEILPNGLAGIPRGLERIGDKQISGVKLIARPHETV